jgi:CspA family cold shock protein
MRVATGIVKWFSDSKGFGFIGHEDGSDIFVHFTAIQMDGFRTLSAGSRVAFDLVLGPKGNAAQNIRLVRPAAQLGCDSEQTLSESEPSQQSA